MPISTNTENRVVCLYNSLLSTSLRDAFTEWLSAGNAKKYSTTALICSFDKISLYALRKKISSVDLWTIDRHSVFSPIYNKLLGTNLLRIIENNTYKVFTVAGRLYLQFLKEKHINADLLKRESDNPVQSTASNKDGLLQASLQPFQINPEDVIAWLLTQPNTNGTLYLENVARQYMYALRSAPAKLHLLEIENRNVFACRTVSELNILWDIFKTASNYRQVNAGTSGAFSAGMRCLSLYLTEFSEKIAEQLPQRYQAKNIQMVPSTSTQDIYDSTTIENLTRILAAHFSNGYRLDSPIEMTRFRSFTLQDLGEELPLSDDELKSYIVAFGTIYDGKVYAVIPQTKEHIKELAEEYFADGAQAIFFSEFYVKNENWLFEASVVSEGMLIHMLRELFPKLSFTQTYFGYTDASIFTTLESELLRVWGDDVLLTYDQLSERLQYIPIDRIKFTLAQNGDFIWNSTETFSHISRIDITDEERKAIQEAAAKKCSACGYVSITDLPLGEIEVRNHELSITAVHSAIYRICLVDKFDKKGKIVTRKGDVFDAMFIMKEYCQTIDKCSLDDLLSFEKELTGEVHRWIPMEAGNAILVRVDKDVYVADKYVHFDVEAVDAAIERFMEGSYLPLKSFTTFGPFPDCGYTWNLFLLESYCRRFSKEFRFDTPSVNSRNAGVVIRKNCNLNYIEIMTDAVANSDVPLNESAIGRFLCDSGYTGRGTTAKAGEIINTAKSIQERRD